jgi:hypothetical protein
MALNTLPNEGLTSRGYPSDRIVTPIIINGDMSVAQRGTSVTGKTDTGYYTVDRWNHLISSIGTWSISQSTDVPTGQGFAKSLKMDCTTADASPASSDELQFRQFIEGQNLQMLKKGTSNAESVTLSFWVKSTKTGTYIIEVRDADNDRNINKSYTINSSDTWEKKTLSFDGDTTGALNNDNGTSIQLTWWLGAGSNFTSGTLATSWESRTNANRAVGQVNLADSTSNEWYITGVQLEVGEFDSTSIPSFPFESFDSNLRKCQRYFFTYTGTTQEWVYKENNNANGSWAWLVIPHHMRTAPTITFDSGWTGGSVEGLSGTISSLAVQDNDQYRASLRLTMSSGQSGDGYQLHHTDSWSDDVASFSAEL